MHFPTGYLISSKQDVTAIPLFSPLLTSAVTSLIYHCPYQCFQWSRSKYLSPPDVFASCNALVPFTVNQLIIANFCWQLEYSKVCNSVWCHLHEPQDLKHWVRSRWSQKEKAALMLQGWSSVFPTGTLKSIFSCAWFFYGCLVQMVFHLPQKYLVPDALLLAKSPDYTFNVSSKIAVSIMFTLQF